ncbi:MAG: hypothetical protein IJY47_01465 [Clostridia bacterium]|nr:hypothetical protein [Clostridia bacterium]
MKQVYILLSKTGTIPSRLIHRLTGGAFTHVSIALAPKTDRFYSYARRALRNPLNAGLIVEDLHSFVFALYPDCPCVLYSVEISDEAYEKIKQRLQYYLKNYRRARYNFLGIIPLRLGIRIRQEFRLVCSQFVALMLKESDEIQLPKDPYLMLPVDFQKIRNIQKIYAGSLKNCNFDAITVSSVEKSAVC